MIALSTPIVRHVVAPLAALSMAGCTLISQRTFDPSADRKPVPVAAPSPPTVPDKPALAVVRFEGAPESWQPGLTEIVRQALSRKPDALFRVQTVVPQTGSPDEQATALAAGVRQGGQAVAQTIAAAGASSAQIDMVATTGAVTMPEVRVTVR
jgi:hypothetical protein